MAFVDFDKLHPSRVREAIVTLVFLACLFSQAEEADVLGVSQRCTMVDLLAETSVHWSDEDHPEGRPL